MSSHILGEVSLLADRIGIIHEGRLIEEFDVDDLEKNRIRSLHIQARDMAGATARLTDAGYQPRSDREGELILTDTSALERPEDITELLVHAGVKPYRVQLEQENLERYFLRLVGADNGEEA